MDIIIAVVLGVIQGITEFLPISSSGHLVISQYLFGVKEDSLVLDTLLHLATAIAITIVFRKDILSLVTRLYSTDKLDQKKAWYYVLLIGIATIPAGLAGVLLQDYFENLFSNPRAAGTMLLVTALLLFMTAFRKKDGNNLNVWKVIIIGLAQAIAIVPGISRSGSTIAVALLIGVSRNEAGRFSFLMALPVIFGAALLQIEDIHKVTMPVSALVLGFMASLVVGIFSLHILLKFVKNGTMYYFGFYCIVIGIISILFIR